MFFKKLLFFIILLLAIDFIIGNILRELYFRQESGLQFRTTYAIDSTNAELVIFGSSRANHHYNPAVFEEQMGLTCYNAGRDGNYLFYHYAILKGMLKRYSPKFVILDFLRGEFRINSESYERLSILLPYYKRHPEIRPIVELQGNNIRLKMYSQIYPFNSSLFTILIGNTEYNKKRKEDLKGYLPLNKIWDEPLKTEPDNKEKYETDSLKIKVFKSFIQECKNSNIKLYIICSPIYVRYGSTDYSVELAKKIAGKEGVAFWDYSQDPYYLEKPGYFQDLGHMNNNGATAFSKEVSEKIKQSLIHK